MQARRLAPVWGRLLLFGFLATLVAGCGPDFKKRATVKGKVTLDGKVISVGTVVFHSEQNITGNAKLDEDGYYVMNDAPLGECRVTVSTPRLPPQGMAHLKGAPTGPVMPGTTPPDPQSMPSKIVSVPVRFSKPETSGLTFKVETGEHTFDIKLSK